MRLRIAATLAVVLAFQTAAAAQDQPGVWHAAVAVIDTGAIAALAPPQAQPGVWHVAVAVIDTGAITALAPPQDQPGLWHAAVALIDAGAITPLAPSQGQPVEASWRVITTDSLRFLLVQHGARIAFRARVREGLKGPFFEDYWDTLSTRPTSFWDGDPWFTNFVAHPIQGSVVYRTARVNGASRSEAFWWGVLYSTQFELGLLGEAAIGNIPISPVDLVVTPLAGWALGVAEEWLVARLPERGERFWLITRPLLMGHVLTRLIVRK